MIQSPFREALGDRISELDAPVRSHFDMSHGARLYRGSMDRVWRRGGLVGLLSSPALRLASKVSTLFSETGEDVPFELYHKVALSGRGVSYMVWGRTFRFPSVVRRFDAIMIYSHSRQCIVDWLGSDGRLEVELHPRVDRGGLRILTGRQWIRIGSTRVPLPKFLSGRAEVHEFSRADGSLGIDVTINNPILGSFMGYEGSFTEVPDAGVDETRESLDVPAAARPMPLRKWLALVLVAVSGTIVYALSFRSLAEATISTFAASVGMSAFISWIGFGVLLALVSWGRIAVVDWIDLCLRTMGVGIGVLALSILPNVAYGVGILGVPPPWVVHLGVLGLSNLAMAAYFVRGARRQGIDVMSALLLWFLGLNGLFGLSMILILAL